MPDVPMAAWELAKSVGEVSMQSSIPHKELWAMYQDACEAAYQVDDGSEGEMCALTWCPEMCALTWCPVM